MSLTISKEAEQLAARGYRIIAQRDDAPDGGESYVATSPEMPFCVGDGATLEAAIADLRAAQAAIIQTLLEDGLPVPEPLPWVSAAAPDPNASPFAFYDLNGNRMAHSPTPAVMPALVPIAA